MFSRCLWMPLLRGRILHLWNQRDGQVCLLLCTPPACKSDVDLRHHFLTHSLHLSDKLNSQVLRRLIRIVLPSLKTALRILLLIEICSLQFLRLPRSMERNWTTVSLLTKRECGKTLAYGRSFDGLILGNLY